MSRSASWLAAAAVVLGLAGCATAPARAPEAPSPLPGATAGEAPAAGRATEPPPASPVPGITVGTTASGGRITTTGAQPVLVDTLPSAEALEVLQTIPEPLPPGERVPPPGAPAATGAAPADTSQDAGEVPVPIPTRPLGDRPAPPVLPDTSSRGPASGPPGAAPARGPHLAPPPSSGPPAPARGASSADTCWRIQVAAPPEPERAQALRAAAESQLDLAWVVERERGLHKVRTRDCLGAEAADRLRRRAEAAGFAGAFRFRRR